MKKVSIIIPTYNVQDYLVECMESVINQTLKDIEIICVDDGSTDNSGSILDQYSSVDERIIVIHNENGGYGKAMNCGLNYATGEFVGIVEPDDYITLDMFETLYRVAIDNKVDFVKSNFKRFYGDIKERTFEEVPLTAKKQFFDIVVNPKDYPEILFFTMNIWTGIYRKEFLDSYNISFNETPGASFQDTGFWFQTMINANRCYFIDKFFYMNRRDNPNSSVKALDKAFCVIEELNFCEKKLENNIDNVNIFKESFVKFKLIAYVGAYNRSSIRHRFEFIQEASKELKKHVEAGEVNASIYGPKQLDNLNLIVSDPIQFFINDLTEGNGASRRLIELNEEITKSFYKLNEIEQIIRLKEHGEKINDNNPEPLVSIIVPTFNDAPYIDDCLSSITSQSLENIEIICINDGSTDDTLKKLVSWAKKDLRIIVRSQENRGSAVARNEALKIAKGKYVMFMDADDWYVSDNIIEKLYSIISSRGELVVGGGMCAYKDGILLESPDYYSFKEEGVLSYVDYQMDYGYTRYIYDLKFIKEKGISFPNLLRMQDPVFFVKVMSEAKRLYAIKDIVYAYRKPQVKKKFNCTQVADILRALYEEFTIAKENNYSILYENIKERMMTEYFEYYVNYLLSNESSVNQAFDKTYGMLSDEDKITLKNKIIFYVSTKYVIPLRKRNEEIDDYNHRLETLNDRVTKSDCEKLEIEKSLASTVEERERYLFEIISIRKSFSYKVGLFITFWPRKIRSIFSKKYRV